MINIIIWIGILTLGILLAVLVSSRLNGLTFIDYFRIYGSELLIVYIFTIILIVYINLSGGK